MKSTKSLLLVTAFAEMATGAALLTMPTLVAATIVGGPMGEDTGIAIARIGGVALVALACICWFARNDRRPVVNGLLTGLLVYNVAVSLLLMQTALGGMWGLGLWPAVAFHLLLASWCLLRLRTA